jgi:S1-C subfamily serine protease
MKRLLWILILSSVWSVNASAESVYDYLKKDLRFVSDIVYLNAHNNHGSKSINIDRVEIWFNACPTKGKADRIYNINRVVRPYSEFEKALTYTFPYDGSICYKVFASFVKKSVRKFVPQKKKENWFKWWYLIFAVPVLGMIVQAFEDNEKNKKTKSKTTIKESKPKEEPKVENSGPQMTGTAFFIDKKGHLITNFHVVVNSSSRLKIIYEGQEYKARILAKDETLDLALIKVSIKNETFIEISDKVIKKMQSIVAAGYPALHLSDDLKLTSGIISSLKGIGNNSALIQIDAALNPGNSGGPIIDKNKGHLAAVAVARMEGSHYQSINYGIKASRVKEFVESNNITLPYKKTNLKDKKNKLDISDVLETSTVLIYH